VRLARGGAAARLASPGKDERWGGVAEGGRAAGREREMGGSRGRGRAARRRGACAARRR